MIVPVLLGSAENGNGILRLLKALRHEAPFVERTAKRLKLENAKSAAHVIKTMYTPHGGKVSVVRVLAGEFGEGTVLQGARSEERAAAAFSLLGQDAKKRGAAKAGETVALGRLEKVLSGETLSAEKGGSIQVPAPEPTQPVYGVAIGVKDRKDEVKLTGALARLMEEDPSLSLEHAKETHQMVLWGQGEMHLRVALERLKRKYGVDASSKPRQLPYKETIRKGIEMCAAATRSSRAATASSATWCSTSSRCRAAAGFQFAETRSPAAWCRGRSSPRSRSACRTTCSAGRWAVSPSSTWR